MGNRIGVELSRNHFSGYEELNVVILDENNESKLHVQTLSEKCAKFMDVSIHTSLTGHTTMYTLKMANPDFKLCNDKFKEYYGIIKQICVFGDLALSDFKLDPETKVVKYREDRLSFRTIDLLTSLDRLIFTNGDSNANDEHSECNLKLNYPIILVLLDSSVTYYLVDDREKQVKFLGNSPIGPVSLLSLFKLFANRTGQSQRNFSLDYIIELAKSGTNTNCDMLVSDIYGDAYKEMGLPGDLLASTFGKLQFSASNQDNSVHRNTTFEDTKDANTSGKPLDDIKESPGSTETNLHGDRHNNIKAEDFAKSLTLLLTINTTHIAYLHSQINNSTRMVSEFTSHRIRGLYHKFFKRSLWTLPEIPRIQPAHCRNLNDPENLTRYVEELALDKCNDLRLIREASLLLNDNSNKLYPLQVVRCLNAFSVLGYSDEAVLSSVIARAQELTEEASPKRLYELLTLYCSLNLSHFTILNPLIEKLKEKMNNYSLELCDICRNVSSLNITDKVLIESLSTQIELKIDDIGRRYEKTMEGFSRLRTFSSDKLVNAYKDASIEGLSLRQKLYLLGISARLGDGRHSDIVDSIMKTFEDNKPYYSTVSLILILQRSIGVTSSRLLKLALDTMELDMNNEMCLSKQFSYWILMSAIIAQNGSERKTIIAVLRHILRTKDLLLSHTQMIHLLYSTALLSLDEEVGDVYEGLLSQVKASCRKLNIKQQGALYDSLHILSKYDQNKDPILEKILEDKIPSSLPIMYDETSKFKIGHIGGRSFLYQAVDNEIKSRVACINESDVLTVVDNTVQTVRSPTLRLDLQVSERLHESAEIIYKDVKVVIPNKKLAEVLT
ncbi:hypothetical protein BEWA_041160 [Theileria equi strain WA]|uniref:Uncharacterized protein n=1 Tax=Theileria equi strain WA TaxID=1537102 RepID=L1LFY7_THEEQ|nr:hypothetical protein BEWA_041160 [Theileria equi strain WA]EKX74078.1 hypothetical protein BEWA_041160 [Theileria equi strain WA]|eukprot:XP_004833530.1 hypothetical protein BEWA_041160 [Theileria equi strain WA]